MSDDESVRAVEVWLLGGPVDGRIQLVELDTTGSLPVTVVLPQTGSYLGTVDGPAHRVDHVYRRTDDIDGLPVYQYESGRQSA
ncbi:hypothetical protein [Phytohabitans rumicis]|uniref:Uncharacterized protein n=1 Tax=Phytohabitans rumicis TaxID=1076125 RepID=A0A6V8LAJ1_9ACTN|nr:hypothetical protein [Phytohabitans rumicis]GFJ93364.1 hypothetical protein Prum_070060 [Phytohabitans rumicis]